MTRPHVAYSYLSTLLWRQILVIPNIRIRCAPTIVVALLITVIDSNWIQIRHCDYYFVRLSFDCFGSSGDNARYKVAVSLSSLYCICRLWLRLSDRLMAIATIDFRLSTYCGEILWLPTRCGRWLWLSTATVASTGRCAKWCEPVALSMYRMFRVTSNWSIFYLHAIQNFNYLPDTTRNNIHFRRTNCRKYRAWKRIKSK